MEEKIIKVLKNYWPKNKAKGLLAETKLRIDIKNGLFGKNAIDKFFSGCWLFAPKVSDFYKFRFAFFVSPYLYKESELSLNSKDLLADNYRPFFAITEYLNNAGIGVGYCIISSKDGLLPIDEILEKDFSSLNWNLVIFKEGNFESVQIDTFFNKWEGNRGRASRGSDWDPEVIKGMKNLEQKELINLLLNELFYAGLIKQTYHKPTLDPYDVDAFLLNISLSGILPMEIKEKFPGSVNGENFFGIDVGRILMLLRICLPNDSNAIYLIREMDEDGNFIGWKYCTLSDIIMTESWNIQGGGPGMRGGRTHTIILPYSIFKNFNEESISEEILKKISKFPKEIKWYAKEFENQITNKFL